jgi:SAM-dependent methyltransferase
MLRSAARLTAGVGSVALLRGDVHTLPIRAESLDRIRTDRVLQHVIDPRLALAELHRVCRTGGRGVFAEPDWGALAIDSSRPAVSDAFTAFTCRTVVRHPRIGREVGRLAVSAGWTRVALTAFAATFTDFDEADRILGLRRNSADAVIQRAMTASDRDTWLDELAGTAFLATTNVIVTTVVKD